MSSHHVKQILQQVHAKYVDSAVSDVTGALREFTDLVPDSEHFMFPDGKRRMAFRLRGTIPVYYKGQKYNIPVSVYLWDTHPYYAPICYVNPTATMIIRESETVSKQGRVYLPYLHEWRFPGYDLNGLLQVMAMSFQERCPLFAKSSSGPSSAAATPSPQPSATPSSAYPSSTPYPSAAPAMPTPYPSSAASTPYPTGPSYPTPAPYPNYGAGYPQPAGYGAPAAHGRTPPPVPPPPGSSSTVKPEHLRASVLSALEDKIKQRLRDTMGQSHAELASIRSTQMELRSGQTKLKQMVDELDRQSRDMNTFINAHQEKKAELKRALIDAGGGQETSIDDAMQATTPLHRQLLLEYAKDLACDDAVYALGQGLKKGSIPVAEYLKRVRDVSRQQFIHRATMQKCRKTAGLPI